MPAPVLPVLLGDVAAYRGDTTPVTGTVVVVTDSDPDDATARMHVRSSAENKVLLTPTLTVTTEWTDGAGGGAAEGRITIAPVTLTPEDWESLPRYHSRFAFDVEVTAPGLGTRTVVAGAIVVTPDVTY